LFKHLLVPLDGSSLAESVLPAAAYLAEKLSASITLIHIIERNAPEEIHGERHLTEPDEAIAYLKQVAERAFPVGIKVEQHVHTSEEADVARSIVDHTGELEPDLIVMCTHGKGGLVGFFVGSIAQQVIGRGKTPVMLIQPGDNNEPPPAFPCHQILVPLDGDPAHEQGMHVAARLAGKCGASLHLLTVVHTLGTLEGESAATARLLPGATRTALNMAEESAESYLRAYAAGLQAEGLNVTVEVSRGDPAANIVKTAQRIHAHLIVLGTHGRSGAGAFWAGSVGPKIPSLSRLPLLLVPVHTAAQ
jgi:nucleotide-binding universal stress UspA family protein